jgi:hypothetical protein
MKKKKRKKKETKMVKKMMIKKRKKEEEEEEEESFFLASFIPRKCYFSNVFSFLHVHFEFIITSCLPTYIFVATFSPASPTSPKNPGIASSKGGRAGALPHPSQHYLLPSPGHAGHYRRCPLGGKPINKKKLM